MKQLIANNRYVLVRQPNREHADEYRRFVERRNASEDEFMRGTCCLHIHTLNLFEDLEA